ncbi:probable pyruvate kinase 2, cytosolic [Coccomyxa sp. Obi]|nr:probable pyruvate kinase 2, cytosolic [Coccomyxa sp. Obi]
MAPISKAKTHILQNIDLPSILEPADTPSHIAGTKVIATLGPACRDVDTLVSLLESGLAAARVDLTWGSLEYHKQSLRNLQAATQKTKLLCAVILDTIGRELMINREYELDEEGWQHHKEVLEVKKGQELVVTTDETAVASSTKLPITYPHFAHMCQPGDSLFVGRYLVNGADQSSLYLEVKEVAGQNVVCTAVNDAELDGLLTVIHSERDGDGMSSLQTDLPLLTELDEEAIKMFTKEFEIDYINLTYTCSGLDVHEMRDFLDDIGATQVKIIAKVENVQALHNFDSIVAAADAVVLSRGNLGLDVAPEKTAVVQKAAINRCNLQGKPVIITRLVDTMVEAPRCTRAEATDVANAVLDGVDGMLLGAETLRGKYAVDTVRTVLSICRQAELAFDYEQHFDSMITSAMDEEDQLLDYSQHGDYLSPPGGGSPGISEARAARSTSDTLSKAATAVAANGTASAAGGAHLPPAAPAMQLPPPHPPTVSTVYRSGSSGAQVGSAGASPSGYSASGPIRFSSSAGKVSSFGSLPRSMSTAALADGGPEGQRAPEAYMSKVESIASTAVRAATKMDAGLIICYAGTGRTASLIAKYRPTVPILALVVPHLKSKGLSWELEGRFLARQFQVMRGLIPLLGAPMGGSNSEAMLAEAVGVAVRRGLVRASQHVVCVLSVRGDFMLKVVSVDDVGAGLSKSISSAGSSWDLASKGDLKPRNEMAPPIIA